MDSPEVPTGTIFAALRIRNEARWIQRVIRSIQPVCKEIFVLDDFSTDATPDICEAEGCTVYRNAVPWVDTPTGRVSDESAGKQFLLERVYDAIPGEHKHFTKGNPECPFWLLAVDGDEELVNDDCAVLKSNIEVPGVHAWSLRIQYLWDREDQWRVDGVYGRFRRPSLFRLMNREFRYLKTPWGNGANFHCSSIPQELIGHAQSSDARLLHWGYFDRELRIQKFKWYSRIDPNNVGEDCYRHVVQGDIPEVPAAAQLRWAGPLELQMLQ